MKLVLRFFRSLLIALAVAATAWFVATQIFDRLDQRLPTFTAIIATYFVSAYVFLPKAIHAGTVIFRSGRIPRYSRTPDGLSADPVNIILFGTKASLEKTFEGMGWSEADRLNAKSSWKMAKAFARNMPYPKAPFSPLYLFGKIQDIGFQEPIGNSPRHRHHIRFWAAKAKPQSTSELLADLNDMRYWTSTQEVSENEPLMWVGAATKDIGFGFAELTFKISHKVDRLVDDEREHVLQGLMDSGSVTDIQRIEPGRPIGGKYKSDGGIVTAKIEHAPEAANSN
ncbi:MAG TPA: LssY C-terminal domain-containing protein [Candidatus Paceibacterota bacterium]